MNIRRTARAEYESFWHYFGFVYFGAVGALYGIVASVLHLILPPRLRAPLGRRLIGFDVVQKFCAVIIQQRFGFLLVGLQTLLDCIQARVVQPVLLQRASLHSHHQIL